MISFTNKTEAPFLAFASKGKVVVTWISCWDPIALLFAAHSTSWVEVTSQISSSCSS